MRAWQNRRPRLITLRDIFGDERDLPNARSATTIRTIRPLGRFWLGFWHRLTAWVVPPAQHAAHHPFVTASARVGSAAAFALTVLPLRLDRRPLVREGRRHNRRNFSRPDAAGFRPCASRRPRIEHRSHVLRGRREVARLWDEESPAPLVGQAAVAGLAFGRAMLTQDPGALVPIPVTIWALCHWRSARLGLWPLWGLVGLVVFFLLWPWLWFDPFHRFLEYAGRTTERIVLYVWYFGHRYADREVPGTMALLFFTTVPLGLQALGFLGLLEGRSTCQPKYPLTPGPSPSRGEGERPKAVRNTQLLLPSPLEGEGLGVRGRCATNKRSRVVPRCLAKRPLEGAHTPSSCSADCLSATPVHLAACRRL